MAAQNRVEALLQATDEKGRRRWSTEQLKSLSIYLDAMNGEGSAAELQKTPPPPPELLGALLGLLEELEVHAADKQGAMAAARLGVAQVLTVAAPSRASLATSPMFIRHTSSNKDR